MFLIDVLMIFIAQFFSLASDLVLAVVTAVLESAAMS